MQTRIAAGGVVYCTDNANRLLLLLINDKYGKWALPKGHLDDGETEAQAAYREILEETGIVCQIGPLIQRITYPVLKKGTWWNKSVAYFLARADYTVPVPELREGIREARWIAPNTAIPMLGYTNVQEIVQCALDMIAELLDQGQSGDVQRNPPKE